MSPAPKSARYCRISTPGRIGSEPVRRVMSGQRSAAGGARHGPSRRNAPMRFYSQVSRNTWPRSGLDRFGAPGREPRVGLVDTHSMARASSLLLSIGVRPWKSASASAAGKVRGPRHLASGAPRFPVLRPDAAQVLEEGSGPRFVECVRQK